LASNNIIIENQHGFREKLSCETQLIQSINDWAQTLDHTGQTDVILLDFSKAFDTVAHNRLLSKLKYYGIDGSTSRWIKSFLSNRKQKVFVNGSSSLESDVISGVPQGSVLGPTLFLLYINDITDGLESPIKLFADDSILYRDIRGQADQGTLQGDLNKVFQWSEKWQMSFNVSKCFHLPITRKTRPIKTSYTMDNQLVSKVQDNKYLGVTIDHNLKWTNHCQKISAKARSTLGIVRRSLHSTSQEVKSRAYQALVRPQLEYAAAAWNPYTKKDTDILQKVQNAAARFVTSDYSRFSSVSAMQKSLGWDSLAVRRLHSQVCMFYKIHHGLVNISFPSFLERPKRLPARSPHPLQYLRVQCSKDSFFYSFYPRIVYVWNSMPLSVISAPSYDQFRSSSLVEVRTLAPPVWSSRI